jgi:hypothetical protein
MSKTTRGIGLIGSNDEPVSKKELLSEFPEFLWWILEFVLEFVW